MNLDINIPISSVNYNGVDIPLVESTSSIPAIFGDGSDGVGLITASTTWNAETEDTGMIIKNFESLIISQGVTVSAGNRNCGMIVRVKGDCIIAGSLVNKMAPKTILDSDGVDFSAYPISMLNGTAGNGGAGGAGGGSVAGGAGMMGRVYGGGWSGGGGGGKGYKTAGATGGSVASITTADTGVLFAGGAGATTYTVAGTAGTNGGGGGGGFGNNSSAPGGDGGSSVGSNGNAVSNGTAGSGGGAGNYGGGVIILLVGGKLTITGTMDCSGGAGGAGGANPGVSSPVFGGGAGGGAGGGGGGRIFICHKGDFSNTGTLNVNGGTAGSGGVVTDSYSVAGSTGTAGTIGTTAVKTYEQYLEEDIV